MIEKIITLDKELFLYLNGLSSNRFDWLWLIITKQASWIPVFILIFYLIYKKIGLKNLGILILFIAVLITFTDQTCNLFKNHFQRLRPCNVPEYKGIIKALHETSSYSFYSGHATNSMAAVMFVYLIIRRYYKKAYLLFVFPLVFGYSRIYIGVHYPIDILTGYFFGIIYAMLFYKLFLYFERKEYISF